MINKIVSVVVLLFLLALVGIGGFMFWPEIQKQLGLVEPTVPGQDYIGKPFVFTVGDSSVTIPDKFPQEVVEILKKNFTQKAGMPLPPAEKGVPIPFGML